MFLLLVAAFVAAWFVVALVLALALGRAVRIAEVKRADEVFVRDLARSGLGPQFARA